MTIANNIVAKLAVAFVAVAMAVSLVAPAASAQTTAELQALIDSLLSQIATLQAQMGQGGSSSCVSIPEPLTVGSQGANVTALQNFLISEGQSIPAGATGYFGSQTQGALAAWQAAHGVSPAVGYYGPITKAAMDATCAADDSSDDSDDDSSDDSDGLEGGAGSLSDVDYITKLSNEEVGEDQEDVEVAGLKIEADDGSDIELRAVALDFSQGTAGSDFRKYADEVSVWFDGEEVARVDADEFEDDKNFDKTLSLDSGAIIRAGDTGELVVAVSGISNLDSSDAGDTWTLQFDSVRFADAQGGIITDTSTGDIGGTARTFSFENFATASDLELKVSKGDDDINDARSIQVDNTNDTDNVEILSFNIQIKGDSDVDIDDLPVDFTSVGAGVGEIINSAQLVVDGEVIGSETVASSSSTTATVTFDNIDFQVEAGDTVEVIVRVDVNDIDGGFTAGDTLTADVNPDDSGWDVEDDNGDDLAAGDKTGSATSEAHVFYADGINVSLVDTSVSQVAGDSNDDDYVTLTIKFDVTSYGDAAYIDKTVSEAGTSTDGTAFGVDLSDAEGTYIAAASTTYAFSSTASAGSNGYEVPEGQTKSFTLAVTVQNAATSTFDGKYVRAVLTGIGFNTDDSSTFTTYTSRLSSDFKTGYGFIAN